LAFLQNDGTPADAVRVARKLTTQEGATAFTGFFTSDMSTALQPQLAGMRAVMVDPDSVSSTLTDKTCTRTYFRTSANDAQQMSAIGNFLADKRISSWSFMGADYSFGHDVYDRFKTRAEDDGATVAAGKFAPLGTTDFGSYVSKLKGEKSQGLFV